MKKIKVDKKFLIVLFCLLSLCILGCVMVYSASSYSALKNYNISTFFLIKQIVGVAIGFCGFVFFYFFDYHKLKKFKWILFAVAVLMLILVFVPGIGVSNYGAKRWIGLFGLTFQPSEVAKFSLVLFCACHFSEKKDEAKSFKTLLLPVLVGGIFCLLVILEPNMSITMCLGITLLCMLFLGGVRSKYFALILIPAILFVPILIIIEPYRLLRLMAFIDPWKSPQGEGFQLIQSLYAIGNGGLMGVGLFSSRQKYLYLPFAESDFIFSIICEELGFFGAIFVIFVFFVLIFTLTLIALNAKDRFGSLLAMGISCVIATQVILNVAVVSGSIPPTGLPLPFISAGSTALISNMAMVGILLNIDKKSKEQLLV